MMQKSTSMDLHLRIDDDVSGAIEVEVHAGAGAAGAYLTCRRVSYEEIGGEAFNARRHRSRHAVDQQTLDELQRLLPSRPLATPSNLPCGLDGTTFTLTVGRGVDAVEYSWWSRPPAEWECLREIVRLLIAVAGVDAALDLQAHQPGGRGHTPT
jgi:hypothetical protein